jgi:integrase
MNVWKRKERNVWVVDYRDKTGKRVRIVGGKTEQEAYLTYAKRQLDEAAAPMVPLKDADITIKDYAERWLTAIQPDLAQRTSQNYAHLIHRHVVPILGTMKLTDLQRRDVAALLAEKRLTMGQRTARLLGKNTIRLIKVVLLGLLAHALDAGLLPVNVALGRFKAQGKKDGAPKVNPMSRAQLAQFMQTMDAMHAAGRLPLRFQVYFAILAGTGMRPSEGLALQLDDLQLAHRHILVERALDLDGSDKPTKTDTARIVDCSETLTACVQDYVTWLRVEAMADGREPLRLFPGMTDTHVRRALARILTTAGLPRFSPYDLRHTYASLLLSANVPLLYVQERLGHSKPTMTLKHYSKWMPDGEQNFSHLLLGTNLAPSHKILQKPHEMPQSQLIDHQLTGLPASQ